MKLIKTKLSIYIPHKGNNFLQNYSKPVSNAHKNAIPHVQIFNNDSINNNPAKKYMEFILDP